jgi:hypothetical protein
VAWSPEKSVLLWALNLAKKASEPHLTRPVGAYGTGQKLTIFEWLF